MGTALWCVVTCLIGNDAFKECDFMQAVVFYTNALDHDSTMAVALSNRAQCWLKLGDFEK